MQEYTLHEAADRLEVHYMTVYRYVRLGLLDAQKIDGSWVVTEEDLEAFTKPKAGRPTTGESRWPERLEARMLAGDAVGAWAVVESAMASGASPEEIYSDILGPTMVNIGDRWERGEIGIEDEHLASAVAGRIIGKLGPRFARRGRNRGVVVATTPPGERHGFGVAMVADILRGRGFEVLELGPDLPIDRLIASLRKVSGLVAVCLSVVSDQFIGSCGDAISAIKAEFGDVPVLVGGGAIASPDVARSLGADGYADGPAEAADRVLELVST